MKVLRYVHEFLNGAVIEKVETEVKRYIASVMKEDGFELLDVLRSVKSLINESFGEIF